MTATLTLEDRPSKVRTQEDRISFISALELAEVPAGSSGAKTPLVLVDDAAAAYTNDGSVVGMLPGLSAQQKDDLLNSLLLAQLAANKKVDRYQDSEGWYKVYVNTLENIAWDISSFSFKAYQSSQDSFTISDVVVSVMVTLVTPTSPVFAFVKGIIDAMAQPSNKDALATFSSNSSSATAGNFQALPCFIDPATSFLTTAVVGSFYKTTQTEHTDPCSHHTTQNTQLFAASQMMVLNETIYAGIRQQIIDKLGDKAKDFVRNIDI